MKMKIRYVSLSLLFVSANTLADVMELKCNWVLGETGGIYYESPAECGHEAVIPGKKRGQWTLYTSFAKPADCPNGFSQVGPVQGGIIGSAPGSGYNTHARLFLEARRICVK